MAGNGCRSRHQAYGGHGHVERDEREEGESTIRCSLHLSPSQARASGREFMFSECNTIGALSLGICPRNVESNEEVESSRSTAHRHRTWHHSMSGSRKAIPA